MVELVAIATFIHALAHFIRVLFDIYRYWKRR